jgi:broad specificity phosphatase PhoE
MGKHRELYLIRHGETEWSKTGQHTGRTDLSLTEIGRQQALGAKQRLGGKQFALVLNSPLRRAKETCDLAGYGNVSQSEPNLMEWNYGNYDGLTSDQIRETVPDWTVWTHPVPGGETIDQVAERARAVVARVRETPGDVAVFSHGHLLRVLIATWLGLPPEAGRLFGLATASITVLGYEHETPVILFRPF